MILHPLGGDAFGFEGAKDVYGVIEDVLLEFIDGVAGPRGGFVLVAGVGPGVAVVEVDEEAEAEPMGAFGEGDGFIAAAMAVARVVGRIHEDAQANRVHPVVFEDLQAVAGLPVDVAENEAGCLHLREPAHVGAFGELGGAGRCGQCAGEQD